MGGALAAAGYEAFAVNPLAVARYRDRHQVSGAKSDAADAKLLADLVRTDRTSRPIAGDTPDVEAIKVLAPAHQNSIWSRDRNTNALRSALRSTTPPRWWPSNPWPTATPQPSWVALPPRPTPPD